jgi:hypothetical protein
MLGAPSLPACEVDVQADKGRQDQRADTMNDIRVLHRGTLEPENSKQQVEAGDDQRRACDQRPMNIFRQRWRSRPVDVHRPGNHHLLEPRGRRGGDTDETTSEHDD